MRANQSHNAATTACRLRRLPRLLLAVCLLLLSLPPTAPAQGVDEYSLKAALIYKLPLFTYWPGEPAKTTNFCIIGKDPFGLVLDSFFANDAPYGLVTIERYSTNPVNEPCHVRFISQSMRNELDQILTADYVQPPLLISDIDGFARAGGMVELDTDEGRLGIQVNRMAAQKRGIDFSAQLLRLVKLVTSP